MTRNNWLGKTRNDFLDIGNNMKVRKIQEGEKEILSTGVCYTNLILQIELLEQLKG